MSISTKNGSLVVIIWENRGLKRNVKYQCGHLGKPTDSSQVWTMKVDQHGNIWFTDEKQNSLWKYEPSSDTFETYKILESESFGSIYPVSLDFDAIGNLYFVGIRSPTLWFGNTTEMSNNTSQGITEIPSSSPRLRGN